MRVVTNLHRFWRQAAIALVLMGTPASGWLPVAVAQDAPVSKVEQLNRAPVSKTILNVKLPKPVEATLPNGVHVMILEDHRFPTVTMQFDIDGAGPLYEPADRPGLAGAVAQLLRQGTKSRSSGQISEQVDSMGATLNAGAAFGSGSTVLTASGLSDNFDEWFALTADVLLHPAFPADEVAQYKDRAKPGLLQQLSQPGFLANQALNRALYGSFPAAVVSATPGSIDALTSAVLADWHDTRYVPQQTILAISGDVDSKTLLPKLGQWLKDWQRKDNNVKVPVSPSPALKGKVYLVDRAGSVQTTLVMGNLAIKRDDPDYPAFVVLNEILGAGPASRLFMNLREEKGYTYGVYSNLIARKYAGPWTAGGALRTEVTDGAMTQFVYELNRIRNEKVSANEIDSARRAVVARFALSLESPQQLIAYAITRKQYNLPADYWEKYPAQIAAVSVEAIQSVAKKYIDAATMQVVAVGDASKIRSVMEKYGPVELVDASGSGQIVAPPQP